MHLLHIVFWTHCFKYGANFLQLPLAISHARNIFIDAESNSILSIKFQIANTYENSVWVSHQSWRDFENRRHYKNHLHTSPIETKWLFILRISLFSYHVHDTLYFQIRSTSILFSPVEIHKPRDIGIGASRGVWHETICRQEERYTLSADNILLIIKHIAAVHIR